MEFCQLISFLHAPVAQTCGVAQIRGVAQIWGVVQRAPGVVGSCGWGVARVTGGGGMWGCSTEVRDWFIWACATMVSNNVITRSRACESAGACGG